MNNVKPPFDRILDAIAPPPSSLCSFRYHNDTTCDLSENDLHHQPSSDKFWHFFVKPSPTEQQGEPQAYAMPPDPRRPVEQINRAYPPNDGVPHGAIAPLEIDEIGLELQQTLARSEQAQADKNAMQAHNEELRWKVESLSAQIAALTAAVSELTADRNGWEHTAGLERVAGDALQSNLDRIVGYVQQRYARRLVTYEDTIAIERIARGEETKDD